MSKTIIPVILCGGSGTRLWPASREAYPKQFLALMNDLSLLQNTVKRGLRGADMGDVVVVTLAAMKDAVQKQIAALDLNVKAHILSEPSARNTAAAVALAADYVGSAFGGDAIMWVLPADHHIGDEAALAASLDEAIARAEDGKLVTFGITPSRPDTGYGYILRGDSLTSLAYSVASFVEKPDLATAQAYLASGDYLWNSGMFVFTAGNVIKEFQKHAPDVLDAVKQAMAGDALNPDATLYAAVPSTPFDKAVMEKADTVAVVPCDPGWSDIGSWESLWDIRPKDQNENAVDGRAALVNARGCLVQAQDRLIAIAGLDNIVVIETTDAIMIGQKSDGNSMKELVTSLKKAGARETIDAPASTAKTGSVSEYRLAAGQTMALPATKASQTLLTVISGQATLTFNGTERTLRALESAQLEGGACSVLSGSDETVFLIVHHADTKAADMKDRSSRAA